MTLSTQTLIDRALVIDLAVAYTRGVDARRWDEACAVFTEDATVDYGSRVGTERGRNQIAQLLGRTLDGLDSTQHLIGNHVVEIEGDRATHSCYLVAQHVRNGELYTVGGTYFDELVRGDDGWAIVHRRLERSWRAGNPQVITGGTPPR
jgi:3-phenylpropionate/cinnamic acid dioxygenase small subunit